MNVTARVRDADVVELAEVEFAVDAMHCSATAFREQLQIRERFGFVALVIHDDDLEVPVVGFRDDALDALRAAAAPVARRNDDRNERRMRPAARRSSRW